MKLIVGLGNPGLNYNNTRHNVGFRMIDKIANNYGVEFNKEKFNGLYGEKIINKEKYLFLKPQSYMNLSGTVVKCFVDYFKINISDILIICDDLDLELGKVRLRRKGTSGGHNGLKNIEFNINTQEYKRLKIGISNNKLIDTKDYVLSKFSKTENNILNNTEDKIVELFADYLKLDFEKLMSKYN